MGEKAIAVTDDDSPQQLRAKIASTRDEMSNTIEELHGRLNPVVFKDQAMGQFHEAADTVKAELKAHFADAKDAMRAELKVAKELVKTELTEAKAVLKSEVSTEIDAIKTRVSEELTHAQAAVRAATIGKVENMVHDARDKVRHARTSLADTVRDNPVPAALIGVGLAWLLFGRRKPEKAVRERREEYTLDDGFPTEEAPPAENLASRGVHAIQDAAGAGASKVGDLAHQAGSKIAGAGSAAGHLAKDVGTAIGAAGARVGHAGMDLGHGAANQARRLQSKTSEVYDSNPLAVGAVVLAVGAAVALVIPHTKVEDRLMGAARDQLTDRAQGAAHDAIGRIGDAAEHLRDNLNGDGKDDAQKRSTV